MSISYRSNRDLDHLGGNAYFSQCSKFASLTKYAFPQEGPDLVFTPNLTSLAYSSAQVDFLKEFCVTQIQVQYPLQISYVGHFCETTLCMSFCLSKAKKQGCFNKMLICKTSYLSINLSFFSGEAPDARVVQVRSGGVRVHVAGGGRHAAPHGARARPRRQEQGWNRDD